MILGSAWGARPPRCMYVFGVGVGKYNQRTSTSYSRRNGCAQRNGWGGETCVTGALVVTKLWPSEIGGTWTGGKCLTQHNPARAKGKLARARSTQ